VVKRHSTRDCVGEQRGHRQQRGCGLLGGRTGETVDILWNTTGVFDVSDSSLNGIAIADASSVITGLDGSTAYYFKVKPYSSAGDMANTARPRRRPRYTRLHFVGGRDGYRQLGGGGFVERDV
jgi:hypothetical protein